jgi:8-oxo-dGTP pyrophosphatase MutT (NUDIX family)
VDQPVRRRSARVLLVDPLGRVLLFRSDNGHWFTAGGGVERGENLVDAAIREVREETGLELDGGRLSEVLLRRRARFTFGGKDYDVDEEYVAAHVATFQVDTSGFAPYERDFITAHRWWSAEEIRSSTEPVWPEQLAELLESVQRTAA